VKPRGPLAQRLEHLAHNEWVIGSNPIRPTSAGVAQWIEQLPSKQSVGGSSPSAGTKIKEVTLDKPKYSVPSMEDIAKIPWNGYNAISTFSGAGGSSLGYKMAGFRVLWANEFIPAAQKVYELNHPTTILNKKDIRNVSVAELLSDIKMSEGQLDLFDGSPPCASFSNAGTKDRDWGKVKEYSGTHQVVDDLFFEYTRLVRGVQPKVFVAENVPGLLMKYAKEYFMRIYQELQDCGYNVAYKVINAAEHGVPQSRKRLIFIGVRKDLGVSPDVYPTPLDYSYKTSEVLSWVVNATRPTNSASWGERNFYNRPSYTITVNDCGKLKVQDAGTDTLRKLSIDEVKLLSSFPADFQLPGAYTPQFERLARAVPPLMMRAIASSIKNNILDKVVTHGNS
jgi:DNA (cytosine-5)-methyltransferase 1